ncbi:MAG: hypothetical protein LBU77_02820 [Clostridiales bacterium]|jgi:hypothetical protein|nr:hypothetical protein [Clostridiales bacterium]
MDNQKEIIDFAIERMADFQLEDSSEGDNRSIFSLIKALIESANGETPKEYRQPLTAVLVLDKQTKKFMGCKLHLLQKTIEKIFGERLNFFKDQRVIQWQHKDWLRYLEACRRVFVSKYVPTAIKKPEPPPKKPETALERAYRLAQEKKKTKK